VAWLCRTCWGVHSAPPDLLAGFMGLFRRREMRTIKGKVKGEEKKREGEGKEDGRRGKERKG